jgi:hypothetical protein
MTKELQGQKQMWGFLRCATDDETVRRFGRNDDFFSIFKDKPIFEDGSIFEEKSAADQYWP